MISYHKPSLIWCLSNVLSRKEALSPSRIWSIGLASRRQLERVPSYHTLNTAVDKPPLEFGTITTTEGGIPEVGSCSVPMTNNNWLVVGDGDLSYSAAIAEQLTMDNIRLFATVLEEKSVHNRVYKRSKSNTATILFATDEKQSDSPVDGSPSKSRHSVRFGVDATCLITQFPGTKFRTIEFNFPHWRGKTNAKRNRKLLNDFFASAAQVLDKSPGSEIRIALCQGQGGLPASSIAEWRQSWLAAAFAAEHGLLLKRLTSYTPDYEQSSHRGVDRPWIKDGAAQQYAFGFPDGNSVEEALQICCRHELRIMLHPDKLLTSAVKREDLVAGDAVFRLAQGFIPDGIRIEVVARNLLTPYERQGGHVPLAVFLLNYSGDRMPLTRALADCIRASVEAAVMERWNLDVAKGGRLVSRPYPRQLLSQLIKEYD